nr:hypothetical protein [Lachnospiraceae bacterium]
PEWTPVLEALGLDSTLEAALNMAMIKEGLAGNVKAYEAIARYAGQSDRTEADQKNVEADIRIKEARAEMEEEKARANETEETADDGFLDALAGSAAEDWADEED